MYYNFKYQNDDYSINLDKIEFIIKSNDVPKKRIFISMHSRSLVFSFNSEEELNKFYNELISIISMK